AEVIALVFGNVAVIEKISRVESIVAHKFIQGAVKLVCSGGGHDAHLRSGTFSIFGTVGVLHDGEFTHGVDAEQLAADSSRCVVYFRSACKLYAVQQKEILLGAASGCGEHVSDDGV